MGELNPLTEQRLARDRERVVELTRDLVRIRSVWDGEESSGEAAVASYIAQRLTESAWPSNRDAARHGVAAQPDVDALVADLGSGATPAKVHAALREKIGSRSGR